MFLRLCFALGLAALFIAIEHKRRPRWTGVSWEPADYAVRVGIWVPWLLGIFALLAWMAEVIVR